MNASTDQGVLVACYPFLRTTKAPVGTSKELTETTTSALKESFQFVSFKIVRVRVILGVLLFGSIVLLLHEICALVPAEGTFLEEVPISL